MLNKLDAHYDDLHGIDAPRRGLSIVSRGQVMATREMVYINVGWMLAYKGGLKHDPIRGGHEYLRSHGEGHEAFNFAQKNGTYYGHVPDKNNIRIRNVRHNTDRTRTRLNSSHYCASRMPSSSCN